MKKYVILESASLDFLQQLMNKPVYWHDSVNATGEFLEEPVLEQFYTNNGVYYAVMSGKLGNKQPTPLEVLQRGGD